MTRRKKRRTAPRPTTARPVGQHSPKSVTLPTNGLYGGLPVTYVDGELRVDGRVVRTRQGGPL